MKTRLLLILAILSIYTSTAQDSTSRSMDSITLIAILKQNTVKPLPDVQGVFLFSGKKTELIGLSQTPADISNKSARQLFARVPGVFVYDMDGAGNQVNISTRGLDPHRGWEFNNRKDGIIINSDMYGYPASHYSMPMESIARIELVRGTGSLQYGAQFGGMINYVSKQGDSTRPFSFENSTTVGSYNQLSSYSAISGKTGPLRYYAYLYKKTKDGFRDQEHTDAAAQAIVLTYEVGPRISIRAEWARSTYRYRIPGALNDSMFHADPRQATRSRNYFSPDIHIPSVVINWRLTERTRIQLTGSAVLGKRNSVLFDKPVNVADTINTSTGTYNNRQVDIDRFNSYTSEIRLLHQYKTGKQISHFIAGIQLMKNDLHRTQIGKGSTDSDYDIRLVVPGWGRDLNFKPGNVALFAENAFQLSARLRINLGGRIESGKTDMSGDITYYPDHQIPLTIRHRFPLFGAGLSWLSTEKTEWYAGISQSYRPMIFKDLVPGSLYEKVDPAIKDARGFNAEIGYRGSWKFIRWDITGFLLQYNNRFGTLAETDNSGTLYTYRTNTGNSRSAGAELTLQADWHTGPGSFFSFFSALAVTDARYTQGSVKSGNGNISIKGNKVESAPSLICRNGISLRIPKVSFSLLYSYTEKSYADPLNTIIAPASTGAVGLVPSYSLLDFSTSIRLLKNLETRLTINNLADKMYFTKRPLFYPGPGVWPSEGRNINITCTVHL